MARSSRIITFSLATLIGAVGLTPLAGCKKKKTPPPPPPPPPAKVDPFEDLSMDARVQFPQERDPATPEMAQAIADLASAFATGDGGEVRALMAETDQSLLSHLLDSGQWAAATRGIEIVRICALEKVDDSKFRVGLGIQNAAGAYLIGMAGAMDGSNWLFQGIPLEAHFGMLASEFDGVPLSPPMIADAATDYVPPADESEEEEPERNDDNTLPGGFTKPGIF